MFTKSWFRCGLVVGVSLLAGGAVAASAGNGYVEVSSSTPGVVEVVPVGMDFHITTANVSDAFKANVAVNPAPGWNLISPNPASSVAARGMKSAVKATRRTRPAATSSCSKWMSRSTALAKIKKKRKGRLSATPSAQMDLIRPAWRR